MWREKQAKSNESWLRSGLSQTGSIPSFHLGGVDWDLTSRHFRAPHSQLGCAGVVEGIILRFGLPLASRYPNLSNNF